MSLYPLLAPAAIVAALGVAGGSYALDALRAVRRHLSNHNHRSGGAS